MTKSNDVRAHLLDALRLDLVGPRPSHPAHSAYDEEVLPIAPSKWYLTGFLIPYETPVHERADDDGDEPLDDTSVVAEGDDDTTPEQTAARKAHFPSSMGLSVLVSETTTALRARVAWGDYVPLTERERAEFAEAGQRAGGGVWKRVAREAEAEVPLREGLRTTLALDGHPGLQLAVSVRSAGTSGAGADGARSVSVFLVNRRAPAPDMRRDAAYLFQPDLTLHATESFVARPDLHGHESDDWDEQVADLQFRDAVEYAVGHNVSAMAVHDASGACHEVRTAWMPIADVAKVVPRALDDVQLQMEALAEVFDAPSVRALLGPMVQSYATWIDAQAAAISVDGARRTTAEELLGKARHANERIRRGLDALDDALVFDAFRLANRATATAIRQRSCHDRPGERPEAQPAPTWRPFQLAFLLMNLCGTADPTHPDRRVVDLLFFPTGGGKTEAYLGLAAFSMFLRRLRDPSIQSAGLTVLMRYTLRLLTLDQLGRAATLVCAMEQMRQADEGRLGEWPFEIGLWVGQSATPNRMGTKGDNDPHAARARTIAFLNDSGRKPSPIPLENCPWCGTKFTRDSFQLLPNADAPTDLRVFCDARACDFTARAQPRGLPVLSVDESIYRRLPAFLIATVDKFASLPWVGESAGLFGKVQRYDRDGFYGPSQEKHARPLAGPLDPPDLIIQDELHLISGPLGTMVGLYETVVDALSTHVRDGKPCGPKIVASTATVRSAERQIQALFGRTAVTVFPPPGPDRRDSFFAVTVGADERNPRRYVGIAAPGRNLKVVFLRTTVALMAAAQKAWDDNGRDKNPNNPADPYMTTLGYFNSLRELGGSRRIVEDEVGSRLKDYGERRRTDVGNALFANRPTMTEPRELTSRVPTNEVAETKRRLALGFREKERVDVALATNMISVGLDITRLGLMVVLGQPKTASEYIQATSRVGRDDKRPGLVVTLLNVYRPRDRSHYERFAAWHESFYRSVEATSVTPFSPRAIDRGIAAVTVALARLGTPAMTAPRGAYEILSLRSELDAVADAIGRRAEGHDAQLDGPEAEALRKSVRERVMGLLDAWANIARTKGALQYQSEVGVAPPLLFDPLSPERKKQSREAQQFKAGRSLRDVEPTVHLWVRSPAEAESEEEGG
jgi:hypothetical protein